MSAPDAGRPGALDGIGIVGLGHAVPGAVRGNDDPLFAGRPASEAEPLFSGFQERRVLAPGERLESLGAQAARVALADAGVQRGAIDRLYGAVSPSEHLVPSGLFAIHDELGLRRDASVVPVGGEHASFALGLASACEAVAAGRCALALVVVAGGWSRLVDYADPGAVGIGDGAAAVVVGRGARWCLVDQVDEIHGDLRDAMTVQVRSPRRPDGAGPRPTFVFESAAARVYRELGVAAPRRLFTTLLERHGLSPADVALVAHQPSRPALDAWQEHLAPGEMPDVLATLGNCTLATAAITLSLHERALRSRHVVLLVLGCGQNFSALLLRRA